ncbi:MAG: hypothetical protein ACE5K4_03385 [Candidatus Hydrothermarchaeota archaeon]
MEEKVERYSLSINPFGYLASESLDNIKDICVYQDVDYSLLELLEEVKSGESRVFSINGPFGTGKTLRLKFILENYDDTGIYTKIPIGDFKSVMAHILKEIRITKAKRSFIKRILRRFYSSVDPSEVEKDPIELSNIILEEVSGCVFLIDELENISKMKDDEIDNFFQVLKEMVSNIPPKTMLGISCTTSEYFLFKNKYFAFFQRIDKEFSLKDLTDEEAIELVKKRLQTNRILKDLDPLYPFSEGAIAEANNLTSGNPRNLLKLLQEALRVGIRDELPNIEVPVIREVYSKVFEPYKTKLEIELEKIEKEFLELSAKYDAGEIDFEVYQSKIRDLEVRLLKIEREVKETK